METINWMDVIPAGFAIVIFSSGLFLLVAGAWSARDK